MDRPAPADRLGLTVLAVAAVSVMLTNHVRFFPSADFEKISASLVTAHPLPIQEDSTDPGDTDGEGSGVETEKEWLDEAQLTELAQKFSSKASEVMVIEVRPYFFFFDLRLKKTYFYRGHSGRIPPICPQSPKEVLVLVPHPQTLAFPPRWRAAQASALPPQSSVLLAFPPHREVV